MTNSNFQDLIDEHTLLFEAHQKDTEALQGKAQREGCSCETWATMTNCRTHGMSLGRDRDIDPDCQARFPIAEHS